MSTFAPGDRITPGFFPARSMSTESVIRSGKVVTVEKTSWATLTVCEEVGTFLSHDFRLVSPSGYQTASPQTHAVLWNKGDKVIPKKEPVKSICGVVTIPFREVLTVKEINGDFFLAVERFGIYSVHAFKRTSSYADPVPIAEPVKKHTWTSPAPVSVPKKVLQPVQLPASRKGLKKHFERELGRQLEWRDGYLCFVGTNDKVPNSPHIEKEKKPEKEKEHWSSRY